jgi:hypothetical protein
MSAKLHILLFLIFIGILALNSGLKSNEEVLLKRSSGSISSIVSDSLAILKNITGEWIWDSTFYHRTKTICYAGIYYRVVFLRNFEVKVFQSDHLIQLSKWWIEKTGKDYLLKTKPSVDYVCGYVQFINNSLILRDDEKAGLESYFSKKP